MFNEHADVTALITADGTIVSTYYYDAFGNILENTGDVDNSILYSGYQYDKETGLYYLNARMYDPKIARFLQEDTFTGDPNDPLSLNLYTYCNNNPVVYWDPSGHFNIFKGDDWKKLGKKIVNNLNSAADAVVSFESSLVSETFNNFLYKPTYSISKLLGKAETSIFGTTILDSSAEDYKTNNVDVTMDFFSTIGSNKTAHGIGGLDRWNSNWTRLTNVGNWGSRKIDWTCFRTICNRTKLSNEFCIRFIEYRF